MDSNTILLKELYSKYFKLGVACERTSERWPNNEIGNPDKENLISSQFGSITMANELKPAYNMGWADPSATEDFLPFVINPAAKHILDWAKANNLFVRGHVMVWHSQCPKEAFCKGYKPVTIPTDPEKLKENPHLKYFEKLDPVCYVSRETMLNRLSSYIESLLTYMYANGYARTIYAWDVVNEAIELEDKTPTGLRNTYWYQIIGEDFMYYAFLYAHNAVQKLSVQYAAAYGIDPTDEEALKVIRPALFYNDYNEMDPAKKDAIIAALTRQTTEHGSIVSEHLMDGIGMQGHVSDTNDVEQYIAALKAYNEVADQVHITELDVKCTCTNINAEYYQALFYRKLFTALVQAVTDGVNLTSVTLWGLTDDNSWIHDANPLLFRGDLSPKKAFDALVYAVCGGDLGEPEIVRYDLSDRFYNFDNMEKSDAEDAPTPEKAGFKMIGWGRMELEDKYVRTGRYALANEKRFGSWSFIGLDLSDFIGQTIEVSAVVSSPADSVTIKTDNQTDNLPEQTFVCKEGEWTEMKMTIRIPGNLHSATLMFVPNDSKPETFSPIYIDEVGIRLIGLEEKFEDDYNIASIRGAGHLPVLTVTDRDCHTGTHSLLVMRQEKDATVKFDISQYIGREVRIRAFVKTADSTIRLGINGAPSIELITVPSNGEWTKVEALWSIPETYTAAEFYVETDGNSDMLIDDILVTTAPIPAATY